MPDEAPKKNAIRRIKIDELTPDRKNANRGTERGLAALDASIRDLGIGRGIVADKDLEIIGGNKTLDRISDLGIEDVIVVPTDGKTLVVTQRTDLDLDDPNDPRARRLALADNRIAQLDLDWNAETLLEIAADHPEITEGLWTDAEWKETVLSEIVDDDPETEKDAETLLDQAVQIKPPREYAMIVCDDPDEWERLRQILNLQPVRRGGYKLGSPFDDIGIQRVVRFSDFLFLIADYLDTLAREQNPDLSSEEIE